MFTLTTFDNNYSTKHWFFASTIKKAEELIHQLWSTYLLFKQNQEEVDKFKYTPDEAAAIEQTSMWGDIDGERNELLFPDTNGISAAIMHYGRDKRSKPFSAIQEEWCKLSAMERVQWSLIPGVMSDEYIDRVRKTEMYLLKYGINAPDTDKADKAISRYAQLENKFSNHTHTLFMRYPDYGETEDTELMWYSDQREFTGWMLGRLQEIELDKLLDYVVQDGD